MSSLLFSPNIFTPVWFFLNMTKPLGRQCRPFCFHQKFSRKIESTRHEINNPATTLGTTMSSLLDQLLIFPWQIHSSQFYRNKKKTPRYIHLLHSSSSSIRHHHNQINTTFDTTITTAHVFHLFLFSLFNFC